MGVDRETVCVLIVDDDSTLRSVLAHLLQRGGYGVVAVESGEKAIALCNGGEFRPAGVVLDWTLEGMDGAATLAALRCIHPSIPVVISSGLDRDVISKRLLDDCHTKFLKKPYTRANLIKTLGSVIS